MRHIAQFFTIEYHRPVMPASALCMKTPGFADRLHFLPLLLKANVYFRDC